MKKIVLISLCFCCFPIYSQQTREFVALDSLQNKSYEELTKIFQKEVKNINVASIYAQSYVSKGKKENNIKRVAEGFNYLAFLNKGELKIKFYDSIIKYTKDENLKRFPIKTYVKKAQYYYANRDFKSALDNCIKANLYVDRTDDKNLIIKNNFRIGLIKTRLGYYEEALTIFKKSSSDYLKENDTNNYLTSIYAIADTFRHMNQSDSASFYNEKGLKMALVDNNDKKYNYFLLNEGVNQYEKKKYGKALDYIQRSLPYIKNIPDRPNEAMGNHFLGKINFQLGKEDQAEVYLKKVDTIYLETKDIHPELRSGYEILISRYRKNKDQKQQLIYISRLLQIDSLLKSNYEYLSRKLTKEYDTPKLVQERDMIIDQLKNKNKSWVITLIVLIILFLIIFYYYYRKQKNIEKKFEKYIQAQPVKSKPTITENTKLSISQDIQQQIIKGLDIFESNTGYLDNEVSLNSLAKQLNTNTNYLSKVVNFYKEKSFGSYINDLRLDHTIDRLTKDKVFRKYSVKAISEEVGFNNPESFSKAFYKKTEIKPSSFIKQLEKKE